MDVETGNKVLPVTTKTVGHAVPAANRAVITWKSLNVAVQDVKGNTKHILKGVNGYLQPTNLLAIMGPSGSGKTTLLDTLAGRLSRKVQMMGDILLNGHKSNLSYGVSAYVTQNETLVGTLSVREALRFVAQLRLPSSMSDQAKMERVEEILSDMGLQVCGDTKIGNWHLKGISGGQKRRLSIACELITHPTLLFLDEPTSGLDSASAFHVIKAVRTLAEQGRTILTVLHQPSSETFELFDYLCLLSTGQVVFFGTLADAAVSFMTAGLACPEHRNPADHYIMCINRDFEEKGSDDVDRNMNALIKTYSDNNAVKVDSAIESFSTPGHPYSSHLGGTSWFGQTAVLVRRMTLNFWRNLGVFWLRVGMYAMLCLCIGTIFFDLSHSWTDVYNRSAMIFFIVAFLTFMSISGFPSFEEDMQVFIHERLNGYYGVSSFVVANTIASAPFILGIAVVSSVIVYWLSGLDDSGHRVPYFIVNLYLALVCVESLMMAIAAVVPHYLMGIAGGAGLLGMFMLVCGFFKRAADLPAPVWRYPLHYISFHTYSFTGMMHNEFDSTHGWACPCSIQAGGCDMPCTMSGRQVLDSFSIGHRSKWLDLVIVGGMSVMYRVFFLLALKLVEYWRRN